MLVLPNELFYLIQQRQQIVFQLQTQQHEVIALKGRVISLQKRLKDLLSDSCATVGKELLIESPVLEGALYYLIHNYVRCLIHSAQYSLLREEISGLEEVLDSAEKQLKYLKANKKLIDESYENAYFVSRQRVQEENLRIFARELVYKQMYLDQQRLSSILSTPGRFSFTLPLNPEGLGFLLPVEGQYTSYFGLRNHPILQEKRFHEGVDIAAAEGTPVKASRHGVVKEAGWLGGYGLTVVLDHGDDYQTVYAHLSRIDVRSGETVFQGQVIGTVGSTGLSTGPHLHFEIRQHGTPVDPLLFLPKQI